jgi:hypothetical protein
LKNGPYQNIRVPKQLPQPSFFEWTETGHRPIDLYGVCEQPIMDVAQGHRVVHDLNQVDEWVIEPSEIEINHGHAAHGFVYQQVMWGKIAMAKTPPSNDRHDSGRFPVPEVEGKENVALVFFTKAKVTQRFGQNAQKCVAFHG